MLRLAPVFSNHMVLQRNKRIAFWGECDGERVTITLNGRGVSELVSDGRFYAELPPMKEGGPYTLTVSAGKETLSFEDIMLGEVWLAGGQSNMELELQNSFGGKKELSRISEENIRYYYVPKYSFESEEFLQAQEKSTWECPCEEAAGKWSAVAYYYAKEISKKLGVTVGIIGCNWGGTSASCWMSREMLAQSKATSSYVEEYNRIVENQVFEDYLKEREEYIAYQTVFEKNVSHYYETCENPTWDEAISLFGESRYPGPMGPYSEFRPGGLYEMMLSKVCPYTLAGFLYYQGEEDDHKPTTYYELLTALIRQWRGDWKDETLPFLLVQLPVFQNAGEPDYKNWPLIREAQMRVYQTVRNTGIAVILENGEYGNIHPTQKEIVGKRLALQALCSVYHLESESAAFGPVYWDYFVEENRMTILFAHCDGFTCRGEVNGFELAAADGGYYPADVTIAGNQLVLTAKEVDVPKYARYCWTNYQEVMLFGTNGIPVAPFRTSFADGSAATGSRLTNEGVM